MRLFRPVPVLLLSFFVLVAVSSCVSENAAYASGDTPRRPALPDLLGDHAVLQRSAATHVWGKGTPFAKGKVRIGGEGWFAKSAAADSPWATSTTKKGFPCLSSRRN